MSIAERIPAAQALLAQSRRALEAHGRRPALVNAPGALPRKSGPAQAGAERSAFSQRHGGN